MNVLVRYAGLILCMWLMLAGVCLGSQVYLKDGGVIDGQSVWRRGDKVFVKVNRDILADFDKSEIDLRRTFPKAGQPSRRIHRKAAAAVATAAVKSAPPAPAAPTPTVAKPEMKPAVKPGPEAATPAPQPAAPPAAPAAVMKKEPETVPGSSMPQQVAAGFGVVLLLLVLAVTLLIIAGQWIVFQKAGQAGWKSLIPFYNMYILMIISGKPGWWMFLLFIPLVNVVIFLFAMLSLAKKFGRSELFGVGLLLLPMIFFPLLAFGSSEYEG